MNPTPDKETPTPRTDGMFRSYVSDPKNDGTYVLQLDAQETAELFRRIGAIESALAASTQRVKELEATIEVLRRHFSQLIGYGRGDLGHQQMCDYVSETAQSALDVIAGGEPGVALPEFAALRRRGRRAQGGQGALGGTLPKGS